MEVVEPTPYDVLIEQCKNRSQTEVADYYNVSNHIIRKWFNNYGLDFKGMKTLEGKINKKELIENCNKESNGPIDRDEEVDSKN